MGDLETLSEQGPFAEQLCVLERNTSDQVIALDWTHKSDGLLCADSSGGVTMLTAVTSGKHYLDSCQHTRYLRSSSSLSLPCLAFGEGMHHFSQALGLII